MSESTEAKFVFVQADDLGKPKATARSVIRSHCMRGRNKRADSRRSLREARQRQTAQASSGASELIHAKSRWWSDDLEKPSLDDVEALTAIAWLPSLHAPVSDIGLIKFVEAPNGYTRELLYKFFTYDNIKDTMYPVDQCIEFEKVEKREYLQWLCCDDAFFHSVLLTISAVDDYVLQRPPTDITHHHLRRTLSLLNQRLSEKDAHLVDSTVYIILTLALMAGVFGDYAAASTHIAGLQQIVRLRGGVKHLRLNSKLHFKLDRLDLSWALSTGQRPRFYTGPISWDAFYRNPPVIIHSEPPPTNKFTHCFRDRRLAIVFQDLRHLANLINHHSRNNTRLSGDTFQDAISSIQFRLLRIKPNLNNETDETLRLGMLAFLSTTFRVPGRRVPYAYLTKQMQAACKTLEPNTRELKELLTWLIIVGAISVLEPDEPWLRAKWKLAVDPEASWDDISQALQDVMWISCIHDESGIHAFQKLQS